MDNKARFRVFISGRVQGVWFRETMKKKADGFCVSGWVKNLQDKRVEAALEGEKENVDKLLKWAKRGPFFAKVEEVQIFEEEFNGKFNGFKINLNEED